MHYATWAVAEASGACAKSEKPSPERVGRAMAIFNYLLDAGSHPSAVNVSGGRRRNEQVTLPIN